MSWHVSLATWLCLLSAAHADGVYQQDSVDIDPGDKAAFTKVSVRNPYGDVVVKGQAGKSISIRARKRAPGPRQLDNLRIKAVTGAGGKVEIGAILKGGIERNHAREGGLGIDLEVLVPRDAAVDVFTWHGSVSLSDVEESVAVSVNHGDVVVRRVVGNVQTKSNKGKQRILDVLGDVQSDNMVGDVELERVSGAQLRASVFSGGIRAFGILSKQVKLWSFQGDIELHGALAANTRIQVSAHNGSARLRFLRRAPAKVYVKAKSYRLDGTVKYKPYRNEAVVGYVGHLSNEAATLEVSARKNADVSFEVATVNISPPAF